MDDVAISFIIVNWNTEALLEQCLDSIQETVLGIPYEIFVVDNGSTDGSVSMVRTRFPDVIVIANEDNRGFAAANNQALSRMNGRYALLLNSDAMLTEDAALTLYEFMESHSSAAMACGQLLNEDGTVQNSIAPFPNLFTLLMNEAVLEYLMPRKYPSKRYQHDTPVEIDSGIGACLIVRKTAIDAVGMFDDNYFFFFEETDWAYRMRKAGWKVYHVPTAYIYHLQGQTIGESTQARTLFYRSRYRYFRKWYGPVYNVSIRLIILVRLLINWMFMSIGAVLSLGKKTGLRKKWLIYTGLIAWHMRGCPDKRD